MKCFILAVLLTVSAVSKADDSNPCDSGWSYYADGNKCVKAFASSLSWGDASSACDRELGRLLTIPDKNTQDFVQRTFRGDDGDIWIGLTDMIKEGQYRWVDGTKMFYSHWAPDQPDKLVVDGHEVNEDCVLFNSDKLWNDYSCWKKAPKYICEKQGPGCQFNNGGCSEHCAEATDRKWTVTCTSGNKCGRGFGLEDGKCYDIDECSLENGGCDQICSNTHGSWECTCYPDYVYNGTQCLLEDDTIIG